MKNPELEFKINTPEFLREVFDNNPLGGVFRIPVNVLRIYLIQIAESASRINDPQLNAIMCQMALYEIADPYQKVYNRKLTSEIIKAKYNRISKTKRRR